MKFILCLTTVATTSVQVLAFTPITTTTTPRRSSLRIELADALTPGASSSTSTSTSAAKKIEEGFDNTSPADVLSSSSGAKAGQAEVVLVGCGAPNRGMGWYHAVQMLEGRYVFLFIVRLMMMCNATLFLLCNDLHHIIIRYEVFERGI